MDKYRVLSTLGLGGMGVVVAAEHLQLSNKVAIKFLLPNLSDNAAVIQRFVNEAKAATKINSEYVARVLDVGTMRHPGLPPEGIPYMVMEHLDGKDLQVHVKTGKRFPVPEAISYTAQAAEALAQAHKVNIIHRDVKPANLFLAEDADGNRKVKVLDFGISKLLDEDPQEMGLTKTTTVLGSGLYMSPEQMRSAKNVDFRTDIYSLGICMYELLTGTQPFTADSFSELCVKVNIDPPTPIHKWRPDISKELAAVIARAYARNPDERYQTVQAFARALEPFAGIHAPILGQVQQVTRAEGAMASIPPGILTAPVASNLVGQSTEATTATTQVNAPEKKSKGGMVLLAGGLIVAAIAGSAVVMLQSSDTTDTSQAPAKTNSPSVAPKATETAVPPETPPSAVASAQPATSASAANSAAASASASNSPETTPSLAKPSPPPPRVVPRPKIRPRPKPKPKPMNSKCGVPGENGLLIPCDLAP
jgi:eukaryotic-like serine/threonine-protein kinase